MKVGIVMPAYNEEKRIGATLDAYSVYFENLRKSGEIEYEILVSINNTKDKTEEIVKYFSKRNKNIKYLNLILGGKGYAIIEGFKTLIKKDFDYVGFVDADMATSPDAFYDLIKRIANYDGIIASRYIKGAKVKPKQNWKRIVSSRMFNFVIRAFLMMPYKDTQCGAKIFKKEAIDKVLPTLTMSKWAFDVDLLYSLRKNGFVIKEHPTIWADKEYTKINFIKSGPIMVLGVIRLRLINSPLKCFIRLYDFVNEFIKKMAK